jgi:hypothetical protein
MTRPLDGIKIPKLGAKPLTAAQKKQAAARMKANAEKVQKLAVYQRLRNDGVDI